MARADLQWWLNQAGRRPLLSAAQEIQLGHSVRGWLDHPPPPPAMVERRGRRARDRLVESNLRLVASVAQGYSSRVSPSALPDLIQAGNMGLIRAAEKYDPTRGYRFTTYSYAWIRQALMRHVENVEHSGIRPPQTLAPQAARLNRATADLAAELGRAPRREELAERLRVPLAELDLIASRGLQVASLDQVVGGDGHPTTLGELIAAPGEDEPPARLLELREALSALAPQQRQLLELRWGVTGPPLTVSQIVEHLGLSRPVVQGLIDMAVVRIRIVLGLDQQQELPLVERFHVLDQMPLLEVPLLEVPRCQSRAVAPPPPPRESVAQLSLL
jgi:RNA polymerase sigma factor (sigma-70 family)